MTTPLQMAAIDLERRAAGLRPGPQRQVMELAAAVVRSYEEYEPEYDLEQYKQGFKDANKIHRNGQPNETIHEHKFRQGQYGVGVHGGEGKIFEFHNFHP